MSTPKSEIIYPEKGLEAYLVVVGSFFGLFTSAGLVNAIGAIQSFVSEHQLSNLKPISVSWVFSVYLSVFFAVGIFIGPVFDSRGARVLLIVATVLTFAGLFGAASSTEVYQFILSFLCLGIGNGISVTPLVGCINHWFLKRRGFMTGIATSAGSFGGMVIPLLLTNVFDRYGFVWGLRILAFLCTGSLAISVFLVKERMKRQKQETTKMTFNLYDFKTFVRKNRQRNFILYVIGSTLVELSLVLLLTYFVSYVTAQGYKQGYLLLTIWNAVGITGRIIPGLLSDYLGKFNVHLSMLTILTLFIFVIWLGFGDKLPALYLFAVLGGFSQGSISGMTPTCLAQISVVSEFGARFGLLNLFLSVGNLVGIPIGAAVIGDGSVKSYSHFVILCGCIMATGTFFIFLTRYSIVGLSVNKKV